MAQLALNQATQSNIDGIVRMDKQTLSNLQNAIDSARAKVENTRLAMLDLVKQAKGMVDSLEGELARLRGDDSVALRIEQNKKLAEIEQKIAEARKRNNNDEVAYLQRALALQQQINSEQTKQYNEKKQQEQKQQEFERQRQQQEQRQIQTSQQTGNNISASDVANSFNKLIEQAKVDGRQEFAKQLMDEAKRLAR